MPNCSRSVGFLASSLSGTNEAPMEVLRLVNFHNVEEDHKGATSVSGVMPPDEIKHFLDSNGYVFVTFFPDGSSRGRIFTGDINPQSPEQQGYLVQKGLIEYLENLVQKAKALGIRGDEPLEIFLDIGHFKSHSSFNDIKGCLDDWAKEFFKNRLGRLYYGHLKNSFATNQIMIGDIILP